MGRPKTSPKRRVNTRKTHAKKQSALRRKSRFFLPWPYIFLILLSVGILLAGWTFQAGAANISVTARIPAPSLTEPAIITSPADGSHFKTIPITVSGTCPLDSYVKIYTNDYFRGSAICALDGTFQLDVDLFQGANQLKARVFNITDDEGPESDAITVYYDVPKPTPRPHHPTTGGTKDNGGLESSRTPKTSVDPFLIKTNFKYVGYSVGQTAQWKLEISGGVRPYALNIDWGDGTNSVISRSSAGVLTIGHVYKEKGAGNKNSYTVKVSGSDSKRHKAYLEFFVIVNPSALGSIVANTLPQKPSISNNWLLVAWPAYVVVVLMFVSFWLGEKEELILLRKKGLLRQRRA